MGNKKYLVSIVVGLLLTTLTSSAWAVPTDPYFKEVPFNFASYDKADLTWSDSADDGNTGSTSLGFSVNLEGAAYSHFDMDSNGYVELLTNAYDKPVNYGYGDVVDLINEDTNSTYLLAMYGDLASDVNGYYGYKLFSDKAIFYYNTETWVDKGTERLNNFEMVLSKSGKVEWNFNSANYQDFDEGMFSGIYAGNTGTLHELASYELPNQQSFTTPVPEPATMLLLGCGLVGLLGFKKKSSDL